VNVTLALPFAFLYLITSASAIPATGLPAGAGWLRIGREERHRPDRPAPGPFRPSHAIVANKPGTARVKDWLAHERITAWIRA
jgi:hypothetical protein